MIVGVDVSSHRIDLAWLDNGKPCRWHQELAKGHLIDRLRSIDIRWPRQQRTTAANDRTGEWPRPLVTEYGSFDVTDIAIEYPFGRGNAIAALMSTVGVITRQAPPWARVAWPSSGELRAAIGARNTKQDAHQAIQLTFCDMGEFPCLDWDEHSLDALVAALGWRRILDSQEGPEQVELGHPVGARTPAHSANVGKDVTE